MICVVDRLWDGEQDGTFLPHEYEHPKQGYSFCQNTLARPIPLIIGDLLDHGLSVHPLVQGDPHLRFYVGAPLEFEEDFFIGALCLFDTAPRPKFCLNQCPRLTELAASVTQALAELLQENKSACSTLVDKLGDTNGSHSADPDSGAISMASTAISDSRREDPFQEDLNMPDSRDDDHPELSARPGREVVEDSPVDSPRGIAGDCPWR